MKLKYSTNIRIEPNNAEKINFIAKKEHRSLNNLIELLIINYVEKFEKEHGKIKLSV